MSLFVSDVGVSGGGEFEDNITDWCLAEFQTRYGDSDISKDDIWDYLYGVMHAPDWREKYAHDLQRSLPRVPLAADFEMFRDAGRLLMDLHINFETVPEHPQVVCLVDGSTDEGDSDPEAYRIKGRMRWGKNPETKKRDDYTTLEINDRCMLTFIPVEAQGYTVSGRSPLDWAIDSLRHKEDKPSGITDDPNGWHLWSDDPFNLIRHLRRLVYVSTESTRIIATLPSSLEHQK